MKRPIAIMVICLMIFTLTGCAQRDSTIHFKGDVHSQQDVKIEYKKSEEQEKYEDQVGVYKFLFWQYAPIILILFFL
jgi:uncharacterized lipoprotein YehR (DUF1307 family)